ncbi:MAG: acyl-CoA dehydrogenase family protein [Proteobacteria bacterium]|nr:acyl-CoA dehydrogenase family protein [Pseudomonadota bacterium]
MNFDLTEEQVLLQETLHQFVENECPPVTLRERYYDGDEVFDAKLWSALAELGLAGLLVPEENGGAGLELLDAAAAAETLGYRGAPGPFLGHTLATLAIALGGSDAQRKRWLPGLATGDAVGSVALAEGGARWGPEQWKLAANGKLAGQKRHVPSASAATLLVVGTAGGGLSVVESSASGVRVDATESIDRTRPLDTVDFDGAPAEALENGAAAAPRVRDAGLVLVAADAWGGALRLLDMCVEYAKTREQFGVKIGHFQALKHQLANMAVQVEPARGLAWYAAHAFDHLPEEAERAAAIAKAHVTDVFAQVARDAVEAHGGIGFTWECDVQIWFKRSLFDRAFLGTPATHRERTAVLADW